MLAQHFNKFVFLAVFSCLYASVGLANSAPTDINASNLTIAENSAIGTIIGEFNATDPDGDTNITFSLVPQLPSDLNISLWLDASDASTITHSNGSVSQWADKSGNGNHAVQSISTNQPFLSSNKVQFDGANDGFNLTQNIAATELNAFFVLSGYGYLISNDVSDRILFHNSSSGRNLWWKLGGNELFANQGVTGYSDQDHQILEFSLSSNIAQLRLGGDLALSKSNVSGSFKIDRIGLKFDGSTAVVTWSGSVMEMIVCYTQEHRHQVEGYLAHKWGLGANLPSSHPFRNGSSLFSLDSNGTLTANQTFDYETDDLNYSIIVRATDDHNASFDKNFTVQITNLVEDLDGDGTEDYYDDDIDGDGLTNTEELAYNSDPWDASSSNRPPSDINASNLTISENSAIGTVIGEFNATDPDGDTNITLSLPSRPILSSLGKLKVWLDASESGQLSTSLTVSNPPASGNQIKKWFDLSGNGHHAESLAGTPTWSANSFNSKPGVVLNQASLELMNSKIEFDGWNELTVVATFYQPTDRNFATLFGKANFVGWAGTINDDLAWSVFSHRLDMYWNLWGPAIITDSSYEYLNSGNTRLFQASEGGGPGLLLLSYEPGSLSLRINGKVIHSSPHLSGTIQQKPELSVTIGGHANSSSLNHLVISEFMIFNEDLSVDNDTKIEGYLAHKWNIDSLLPDGHGYKFDQPFHRNHLFTLDENGTLRSASVFDHESYSSQTILVQATDDLNASSTQTFTVQISNVIEDLDGDGTEDYYDNDIDGDGVSNANEILYSSDPWDAGSTNSPPFSFSSSSLTVAENSSIGTVVGEFNGTSSNSDDNFTFRILPDAPDGFSPLLWLDAADPFTLYSEMNRTNYALSGAVAGWADKSGRDQHFGQSTSSARPSTGNRMFNGLNVLDFNGAQWMKSNADFATGTDFSIYMFAKVDAINHENDSLFCLTSNDPDFQIDAGHSTQFRAKFYQSGMGSDKIFASSAMHQAGVWAVSFTGSRSKHVGISFNGEGLGGGHSYNNSPKQTTNTLNIFSNRAQSNFPDGFVGEFIVVNNMDYPGGGGVQEYLQRKWLGETYDHDAFVLDTNGTLLTNRLLDFEADEQNQTIQIIASTGTKQSIPQEFIVSISDVEEDLDGDGVEDFYDSDSDGDGLGNLQEFYGRSDPMNSSSSNAAPSEINATTSLSFSESLALGAIAVDFNATDANSDANLTYRVQPKIDISHIPGITGWFDASDMNSLTTDLSGNTVLSWENQVDSSVAMVAGNKPPSSGTYLNGLHALFFDRNETMVSKKGDDVWSPWTSDGSIAGSFTDGSFFLVFRTYENQRTSLPNLGNWWGGHMPWQDGHFFWDIRKGGEVNRINSQLTSGHENMVVSFYHSVTDSSRQFFKNGKLIVSGSPVATTVLSPVYFPSTYNEPKFLYGEMIFVRQNITHANREKIEGYLTHKWGLADQLPSEHAYAGIDFTIDENGSLRTARAFDYESEDHNYSVRIWATDEHNASTHEDFVLTLTNVVEDLDGDGTEDHYDDDIDGDGLTNAEELAYNSDPWDASSSNRPPSDINTTSNLTIAENSAIGTVIGEFNATDPDGEGNFTFYASSIPIKAVTKQNNLIGWFKFDENNGTIARNSGLSDINGTLVGDASFTNNEAKFGGYALQVNPGGRIVLDDSIGGRSHTIAVWFKELYSTSTSNWRVLARGEEYHNYLMLNVNGSLGVFVENTGGSGSYPGWVYSSKVLTPENTAGSWHHLVLTANGYDGKFYLDGEYVSSLNETSPSIGLYYIGNTSNGSQPFAKYIDDFRLYNAWLSADDISKIYGAGSGDIQPTVSIDQNGTLTTNRIFDYELDDANFTVRIGVRDDHNISFEKDFLVFVSDLSEDLDSDGILDQDDQDWDGDGVDNLAEYRFNSSPFLVSSFNSAPYQIFSTEALTISENSDAGTFVADFNASDAENNQSITFSLFSEFPLSLSPKLWLDASDESTVLKVPYRVDSGESNSTMSVAKWFNKASAQYNAVPYGEEISRRPHFQRNGFKNEFPCISFDGGNDLLVVEDSKDAFDAWSELSIIMVYERHGLAYWVPHLSKGPKYEPNEMTGGWEVILRNFHNGAASWRVIGLSNSTVWHDMWSKSHWSPSILTLTLGGGEQVARLNGSVVGSRSNTGTIESVSDFPVVIGGAVDLNGSAYQYSPISFCEILIYNNSLNTDQVDKVESYLAHKWGMASNLPSTHSRLNSLFEIDENGTISANQTFDYEKDDRNYTITVRVTDDHNISFDKNFTITVTNVVEDLDGDGTEDHYDDDIDGDGLTNAEELAYNSDPWDANSSNHPPSDINASNLAIAENSAIGTVIGEFNATDPDGEGNFTYDLKFNFPESSNPVFWMDASDSSTITQSSGLVSNWLDKSGNGNHLIQGNTSMQGRFVPTALNSMPSILFDGGNDNYKFQKSLAIQSIFMVLNTTETPRFTNWRWPFGAKTNNSNKSAFLFGQKGSEYLYGNRISLNGGISAVELSFAHDQNFKIIYCSKGSPIVRSDWHIGLGDAYWKGHISEVISFSNLLSENLVDQVEGYLSHKWGLEDDLPNNHSFKNLSNNGILLLDQNGTLTAKQTFDYETDDRNYSITVRVTDDHNVSFDKNFTITVTNVVEDLDGDGTEDHYDDDIDGDGFTNSDELAYGADPLDPNSVANAAPNSIDLNGTTILENQPKGTRVGQLIAHDPDTNATLEFSFVDGNESDDNSLFEIDENASVRTNTIFDYETDEHNYSIRVRVADEHNFSIEQAFTINLFNIVEDNDQDGVEDYYDSDDDTDGFSDLDDLNYGSDPLDPNSVINSPPYDIVIKGGEILENQPPGTLVAKFFGQDKDLNDTLTYSLVFENSDLKKEIIEEEEQVFDDTIFPFRLAKRGGGLRTRRELDYEIDDHNFTVRIRVTDDLNTSFEKSFTLYLRNVIEDMDGDKIEDYYDDDIDGDGFSNKVELEYGTNPTDPFMLPKIPIVETYEAKLDKNNTFVLSGKVLANGGAGVTDFGIILSQSIDYSSGQWVRAKGDSEAFGLKLADSNLTGTIYYRSWAKNVAGYGVGPVKKVEILEPAKVWWGKSEQLIGGWVQSEWFGLFRTDPSDWLYHEEMNWAYHVESADASVWLWKKGKGWLWTKEGVWPYLWSDRKNNWLYFVRGRRGPPVYFDYSTRTYK